MPAAAGSGTIGRGSGFIGVGRLAFSPDGHRLLAALQDGTVQYWDATPLPAK